MKLVKNPLEVHPGDFIDLADEQIEVLETCVAGDFIISVMAYTSWNIEEKAQKVFYTTQLWYLPDWVHSIEEASYVGASLVDRFFTDKRDDAIKVAFDSTVALAYQEGDM